MSDAFERTRLWSHHLSTDIRGDESASVDRLRNAYRLMRERTSQLVQGIHSDCHGLTVHDITHLDALWEMADLIIGEAFELTPAEVFVLGGSILLHDAGMSVAAFRGGKTEIKATTAWKNNFHALVRRESLSGQSPTGVTLPEQLEKEALFSTLRDLHAAVAERLATQAWQAHDGGSTFLIEDEGLRSAYGVSIGRIAHSHHWDAGRLLDSLNSTTGAAVGLPQSWTVNEAKIAFILRCADAAHIDGRRAPSYLFALTNPAGTSQEHWKFQNRLKQPTLHKDALVYSSGSDFGLPDVTAWWCAFDAITQIHRELEKANSLLPEVGAPTFAARGVAGAEDPRALARYIRPNGWEPVRAEIRASDPIALAKTLGGRNLYGHSPLPVLRELLQNSADAIRARRRLEHRNNSWGKIAISIDKCADDGGRYIWLHVDDDGIGMSQNVLTGPLIDFGKSIWNSGLLREEFPDLAAADISPIGKFGIGFFSVFMLGDQIRVTSKRYDAGAEAIKVLEFSGLARPVLRRGARSDLPIDVSSRVSLRIPRELFNEDVRYQSPRMFYRRPRASSSIFKEIQMLVAALDIEVTYVDHTTEAKFRHDPQWTNGDSLSFLQELYDDATFSGTSVLGNCYARMLRPIVTSCGQTLGRAALHLGTTGDSRIYGKAAVGGFVLENCHAPIPFVGVLDGICNDVARSGASVDVPKPLFKNWLSEQASLLATLDLADTTRLRAGQLLFRNGLRDENLPVCFFQNKLRSFGELVAHLRSLRRVLWLLDTSYGDNFKLVGIKDLSINYANHEMNAATVIPIVSEQKLFTDEHAKKRLVERLDSVELEELVDDDDIMLALDIAREAWSGDFTMRIVTENPFARDLPGFSPRNRMLELTFQDDSTTTT